MLAFRHAADGPAARADGPALSSRKARAAAFPTGKAQLGRILIDDRTVMRPVMVTVGSDA